MSLCTSTFSIVALDPETGDLGVAVASHYFSVGSVVPWAEATVGALATQANVNVGYGPRGLELLRQGLTPREVLERLLEEDPFDQKDARQLVIIDVQGRVAAYTGAVAPSWCGDQQGAFWSVQGNFLAGSQVLDAMGKAFETSAGELPERLYAALIAGDDAGGDYRGRRSASILVVRKQGGRNINNDRYVYLNVDDHPEPLIELKRLLHLNLYYIQRDRGFKLLKAGGFSQAKIAFEMADKYCAGMFDVQVGLALAQYLSDEKRAAIERLRAANLIGRRSDEQWHVLGQLLPEHACTLRDLQKLARQGDTCGQDADVLKSIFRA